MVNRKARASGVPPTLFVVDDPRRMFAEWSPKLHAVDSYAYYHGVPRNRSWRFGTRLMVNMCDLLRTGSFVHLRFLP
jgi:hypothetical protein